MTILGTLHSFFCIFTTEVWLKLLFRIDNSSHSFLIANSYLHLSKKYHSHAISWSLFIIKEEPQGVFDVWTISSFEKYNVSTTVIESPSTIIKDNMKNNIGMWRCMCGMYWSNICTVFLNFFSILWILSVYYCYYWFQTNIKKTNYIHVWQKINVWQQSYILFL